MSPQEQAPLIGIGQARHLTSFTWFCVIIKFMCIKRSCFCETVYFVNKYIATLRFMPSSRCLFSLGRTVVFLLSSSPPPNHADYRLGEIKAEFMVYRMKRAHNPKCTFLVGSPGSNHSMNRHE